MKLTREELINRVRERIGDEPADDDIALLEDITDTYDDQENRIQAAPDWESKYNDLRRKYIDRFNGKVESDADFVEDQKDADETVLEYEAPKTYEDLFEVVGDK